MPAATGPLGPGCGSRPAPVTTHKLGDEQLFDLRADALALR
jgi:hypothetical protein